MAETVRVMLYWNGEIIYGQNGASYNAMPGRFVRVDREISLTEFINLMYRMTGIDCSQYKLKLISRYPMTISAPFTYQCVPIEDDGDLHEMLCIPWNFPLSTVEIYILQEDAQLSSAPNIGERRPFSNVARLGFAAGHDSPASKSEDAHSIPRTEVSHDSFGASGSCCGPIHLPM